MYKQSDEQRVQSTHGSTGTFFYVCFGFVFGMWVFEKGGKRGWCGEMKLTRKAAFV